MRLTKLIGAYLQDVVATHHAVSWSDRDLGRAVTDAMATGIALTDADRRELAEQDQHTRQRRRDALRGRGRHVQNALAGTAQRPPAHRPDSGRATGEAIDINERVWAAGLPPEMVDGIEQRLTEPAQHDDPAELQGRLDDLGARVAARAGTPAGGWQTIGAEQAAHQLADRGADHGVTLETAREMIADYLRETSQRAGAPAQEWGLDQGDLDAIATDHQLPTTLPPAAALAALSVDRHLADQDSADRARTDQLGRWDGDQHTRHGAAADDSAADDTAADDSAAGDAVADEVRWSR